MYSSRSARRTSRRSVTVKEANSRRLRSRSTVTGETLKARATSGRVSNSGRAVAVAIKVISRAKVRGHPSASLTVRDFRAEGKLPKCGRAAGVAGKESRKTQ